MRSKVLRFFFSDDTQRFFYLFHMVPRASLPFLSTLIIPSLDNQFANTLDSTHICRGLALFWCKQDVSCPTTHRDASSSERGHTGPCLRSTSLRLYTHASIAQSKSCSHTFSNHHAVICSAPQHCCLHPAPHVHAAARLRAKELLLVSR